MAVRRSSRKEPERRTLELLEARGWIGDRADEDTGRRAHDWLGVIDGIWFRGPPLEALLVQYTSDNGGNVAKRVAKVTAEPRTYELLAIGCRVEVWGWKPERAEPRIVPITLTE